VTEKLLTESEPGGSDRVPLSLQLDFLRMMDSGSEAGPFGPRYTIVAGWRVFGAIDQAALKASLDDVVVRHETLRTRIVFDGAEAYQQICPPSAPELTITDLRVPRSADRDLVTEEFLNEVEAGVSVTAEPPRLRVALGRFDRQDAVLVLVAHHTMVDGLSAHVLMRDLTACYAARRAGRAPALPAIRQYRDYVAWQGEQLTGPKVAEAREFWREHLRGARMLPFPTDRPRSPGPYTTGWHRFMLADEFRVGTLRAAREHRSSPFMVLMAALMVTLRDRTGETDLVVPTLTAGRQPGWTQDMIGTFYNFMPLRADISGCTTFGEVVAKVRAACLAAYPHELPFPLVVQEAPELMTGVMDPGAAAIAFQVIQHGVELGGRPDDELQFRAIRRRVVSTPTGSQIPDGILAELDLHPDGGMFGKVAYTKHMYDESTVAALMADLREVLTETALAASRAA
jgi:hypothetical protein